MPRRYLLTTCLLSVYDHVILLYVVRRTRRTLYVVRLHHRRVALTLMDQIPFRGKWERGILGIQVHKTKACGENTTYTDLRWKAMSYLQ